MKKQFFCLFFNGIRISLILLAGVFITHCDQPENENSAVISGKYPKGKNKMVYLFENTVAGESLIDSSKIDEEGIFNFVFFPAEKSLFRLSCNNDHVQLILGKGDTLYFDSHKRKFAAEYNIKGNDETFLFEKARNQTDNNLKEAQKLLAYNLSKQQEDNYALIKDSIDNQLYAIYLHQKDSIVKFIKEYTNNIASLFIYYIYQDFGRLSLFDEHTELELGLTIDSALYALYPENRHVSDHHLRMKQMLDEKKAYQKKEKLTEPGNPAPDIVFPDTAGNDVHLSDQKGKYVLLLFWDTQCAPCRLLHAQLIPLYKKYKKKNFEIIGVYVGEFEAYWKAAIKIDKTPWPQIACLQTTHPALENYNIPEEIHRNFLIDKEGIILHKDLEIAELEQFIKNL